MNIADPIVPAVRGLKRTVRKMMTVSQSAQLNGQEGTSADSKPGLIFTAQSQMSMQACAHTAAAPVTLPQDHYTRTSIPHEPANLQAQHHEPSNEEEESDHGMSTQYDNLL